MITYYVYTYLVTFKYRKDFLQKCEQKAYDKLVLVYGILVSNRITIQYQVVGCIRSGIMNVT